jgi:hypothetical protein
MGVIYADRGYFLAMQDLGGEYLSLALLIHEDIFYFIFFSGFHLNRNQELCM